MLISFEETNYGLDCQLCICHYKYLSITLLERVQPEKSLITLLLPKNDPHYESWTTYLHMVSTYFLNLKKKSISKSINIKRS